MSIASVGSYGMEPNLSVEGVDDDPDVRLDLVEGLIERTVKHTAERIRGHKFCFGRGIPSEYPCSLLKVLHEEGGGVTALMVRQAVTIYYYMEHLNNKLPLLLNPVEQIDFERDLDTILSREGNLPSAELKARLLAVIEHYWDITPAASTLLAGYYLKEAHFLEREVDFLKMMGTQILDSEGQDRVRREMAFYFTQLEAMKAVRAIELSPEQAAVKSSDLYVHQHIMRYRENERKAEAMAFRMTCLLEYTRQGLPGYEGGLKANLERATCRGLWLTYDGDDYTEQVNRLFSPLDELFSPSLKKERWNQRMVNCGEMGDHIYRDECWAIWNPQKYDVNLCDEYASPEQFLNREAEFLKMMGMQMVDYREEEYNIRRYMDCYLDKVNDMEVAKRENLSFEGKEALACRMAFLLAYTRQGLPGYEGGLKANLERATRQGLWTADDYDYTEQVNHLFSQFFQQERWDRLMIDLAEQADLDYPDRCWESLLAEQARLKQEGPIACRRAPGGGGAD